MIFKDYQKKYINKLLDSIHDLVTLENKKIIFKSPTGSGKTLMLAETLKRLTSQKKGLAFIWATPRPVLANQSYRKFEDFFKNDANITCSFFEDLQDNEIKENEILFVNWEAINKENNVIFKENEREFYLEKIIDNTIDSEKKIILIIDESHHTSTSSISRDLIDIMRPRLTILSSATPVNSDANAIIDVPIEDVKAEGMIKKSLNIMKNAESLMSISSDSIEKDLIKLSIAKRQEILNEFKKLDKGINPLLLIQLPDRSKKKEESDLLNVVKEILNDDFDINIKNKKLAIWLSGQGNKINTLGLENDSSETEVLIFKNAPALGWDCPRAHVLLLLRNWKSITFTIQIIGRIMRMPEHHHYDNDVLDNSYIYLGVDKFDIHEDIPVGILNIKSSVKKFTTNLGLPSCYIKRQREQTRFDSKFFNIFQSVEKKFDIESKIKFDEDFSLELITDSKFDSIDTNGPTKTFEKNISNIDDLQSIFNLFLIESIEPFFPDPRSIGRLKNSIYALFNEKFNLNDEIEEDLKKIFLITLSNRSIFQEFINRVKESYKLYADEIKSNILVEVHDWDIPNEIFYTKEVRKIEKSKSIMQPFYNSKLSGIEESFINYLEEKDEVVWWFKNGESDRTYFAIPYEDNGLKRSFYVDFIIKTKSKNLYFVDTKFGNTAEFTNELYGKIKACEEFQKLTGNFCAIISNTQKNYKGSWVFINEDYGREEFEKYEIKNWKNLEFK